MNAILRLTFVALCAGLLAGTRVWGADADIGATNSVSAPAPSPEAAMNGFLQIQAQLHDTQMELEKSREEARENAADTSARIQALEQALAQQRNTELEMEQKNQQSMFLMAGAFGLTVLAAVLFMVYLQWRAVTRLVETNGLRAAGFLPGNGRGAPSLVTGAAIADANTRLFGAVDQLQKRLLELERGARAPLPAGNLANGDGPIPPAAPAAGLKSNGQGERIAEMLADGQTLLNADQPEKALRLFEEALAMDPKNAETLIRKGGALEKLERFNEAVACYDGAIAADNSATVAYLQKGGLFNRLARYDEALKCYEQALQAQEKKTARVVN